MLKFLTWQKVRWILPFMAMALLTVVALAQDDTNNVLTPDVPVTGNIDGSNVAQVFTFEAVTGDAATINVTGQAGFPLSIVLTNAQGQTLGQAVDALGNGQVDLSTVPIAVDGTYFATVFVTAGVDGAITEGTFTITLSLQDASTVAPTPEATDEPVATEVPAETEESVEPEVTETAVEPVATPEGLIQPSEFSVGQVLTANGIQVNLNWDSSDDLNLQIRDPLGETLYWDSRTTSNGGTFGFDVNGLCEVISPEANTETASWPAGPVASGSYEILIYYRQACEGLNPVDFSVDITVDGVTLDPITGTLFPPDPGQDSVFISSFNINADTSVDVGDSGPYQGTRVLNTPVQEILDAPALTLALDTPTEGVIVGEQYFQTYQYSGVTGEFVNIALQAQSGSLDTLLLMFDSAGNIVASNDDAQSSINTDSLISFSLPTTDTYTIYATRYGKDLGGTEGVFVLTITGQAIAGTLPQSITELGLAAGDIQVILTWNSNADLRLLVRDPQLNSIYNDALTSPTGGQLALQGNVNCNVAATPFPVSYAYWPPGFLLIGSYEIDIWHRSECSDFSPVTFNLYVTVRGQLILQESGVIEFGDRVITNFTVQDLQGTAVRGDAGILGGSESIIGSPEYNSALETPIAIQEGQAVSGEINVVNPFDVYVFEGRAGDIISIDMQAIGTLDTQLFLISPLGQELAANDDASEGTTNSLISDILLTQDGTYVVVATRFGAVYGGTSGGYSLNLRAE